MNIKSLLIGSAAALAAVSGAKAADAIVAAEPEPLEYVRVCDAFGAGFFYIPGSETCLKFDGFVRFQVNFGRDSSGTSDWDAISRAQFNIDARSDTELGVLRGYIGLQGNTDNAGTTVATDAVFVEQAFIELGGLKVGKFYNWWDNGLSGETDNLASNTLFNSIRYTYDAGSFYAGLSVDELEGVTYAVTGDQPNNVGISGALGGKFGGAAVEVLGGYDVDRSNGAARIIATADVGPGTLGLAGVWASGANAYYAVSEWAVAAQYAYKATDKLTITPGVQYYSGFGLVSQDTFSNNDGWKGGLTVDYKITDGLSTKLAVNYQDIDNTPKDWSGFVRLQRSF
ncbi:porin [Agrobacterium cavarae]|uniref:porin n=1 Tax=Agrobacterium cavarae TaxID=2528239 RepID=UPI0028A63D7C|nr:porin [Agrobacterium cavarae]